MDEKLHFMKLLRQLKTFALSLAYLILSGFTATAQEPDLLWQTFQAGYPANIVAVDKAGNTYVSGGVSYEASTQDIMTAKYSPEGELIWSIKYDRSVKEKPYGMAVDEAGGVYLTGLTNIEFLPAAFIIKYSSSGEVEWEAVYERPENRGFSGESFVEVDDAGNVYMLNNIANEFHEGLVLTRYSAADGHMIWRSEKIVQEALADEQRENYLARAMALDKNGDIYVTGARDSFTDHNALDNGSNYFTAKFLASDGTEAWASIYSQHDNLHAAEYGTAITTDEQGGIYVTGHSFGDYVNLKYDAQSGQEQWVARHPSNDLNNYSGGELIASDGQGGVYVSGQIRDYQGPTYQSYNAGTFKYDAASGKLLWSAKADFYSNKVTAMVVSPDKGVYVTGAGKAVTDFPILVYDTASGEERARIQVSGRSSALKLGLDGQGNLYAAGFGMDGSTWGTLVSKYGQERTCQPMPLASITGDSEAPVSSKGNTYTLPVAEAEYFHWKVSGPAPASFSGQGTASIQVDWPAQAGYYTVEVQYGQQGCDLLSDSVQVAVFKAGEEILAGGGTMVSPQNPGLPFMQQEAMGTFGFAVRYKNNTAEVEGKVAFSLQPNDFFFESTTFDAGRLLIMENKASLRGKGTVNGEGGYIFVMAIENHAMNLHNPWDKFRLKVWHDDSGRVVYDNQLGDSTLAPATQLIASGVMVIYHPEQPNLYAWEQLKSIGVEVPWDEGPTLQAYPTAFSDKATLAFSLPYASGVRLEVFDMKGNLVKSVYSGRAEAGKPYVFDLIAGGLQDGMYVTRLTTESQVYSQKLVLKR